MKYLLFLFSVQRDVLLIDTLEEYSEARGQGDERAQCGGGPCESVPVLCRSTKRDKAMLLKQSKRNATVLSRGSEKEVRGFLRMGRGEMKELSLIAEDTRAPYMQSTDRLTRQ